MVTKCCIKSCQSNHPPSQAKNKRLKEKNDSKNGNREDHVPTFSFPKEQEERIRWIKSIPYLSEEEYNSYKSTVAVCEKHWPPNYETVKTVNGRFRPKHPPSIFPGFSESQIPTPPPKPRTTKRTTFEVRTSLEDELGKFLQADRITNEILINMVTSRKFQSPVTTFVIENVQWIQSNEFIQGIPLFAIKIFRDMTFQSFHMGIQCSIPTLSRNNIYRLNTWSRIDEALRFLDQKEFNNHEKVLQEHFDAMKPVRVGHKVYSPDTLVRAFEYFSTSRCLYGKLREDYKLPSVKVMTNLTSKVNKLSDKSFLQDVFSNLRDE